MKKGLTIVFAIVALLIAIVWFADVPALWQKTGITTPEAIKLINEQAGIENLNKDAAVCFGRVHSGKLITRSELKDLPAVSNLVAKLGEYSEPVLLQESEMPPGTSAAVRIRFGSHFRTHFIYILDCHKPFDAKDLTNSSLGWVQVTSNIFIRN